MSALVTMESKFFHTYTHTHTHTHTQNVALPAKLQISVSFMKQSEPLIKILKRVGPSIDPCGIPRKFFDHSLKDQLT